jgi:hypothetical protein
MTRYQTGVDVAKPGEYVEDLDEQLGELDEDESSTADEPDPEGVFAKRKIFTDKSDPKVGSLHTDEQSGDLILAPIFQRRKVWDDKRSSRLVESAILEVAVPQIPSRP